MSKLIVLGSGIKSLAHITQESLNLIQQADMVYYLVNEDLLKDWIKNAAKYAESLEPIYFSNEDRSIAYKAITDHIVQTYENYDLLCVVFYGHPCVFADSALKAVRSINDNSGDAMILPAVSSLDCLFADLRIDPGDGGLFCIEATELLLYERTPDPLSHVILYQAANLGRVDLKPSQQIEVLVEYLSQFYLDEHPCCIYEAAILPGQMARMEWLTIGELTQSKINPQTSIYISPIKTKNISEKYHRLLTIEVKPNHEY